MIVSWRVRCTTVVEISTTVVVKNIRLRIIKNFDHEAQRDLPKDFRTLFNSNLKPEITQLGEKRSYAYFDIEAMLNYHDLYDTIFHGRVLSSDSTIEMNMHVDGLPIFNSSTVQFWPLLGNVFSTVFIIGVYCGPTKPEDYTILTKQGVSEIIQLYERGITIRGITCSFKIKLFLADAPTRAAVLNVKGHSGYSSCIKCWTRGKSLGKTIYFPDCKAK